jgi:hypothetical protein
MAIKCRKITCVRHVACAERKAMSLQGNMKAINRLEDLGVISRIILKWILRKYDWRVCDESGVGQVTSRGLLCIW